MPLVSLRRARGSDGRRVRTPAAAADELEARLEAMREAAARISDVAVGITILTHAILLFGMV